MSESTEPASNLDWSIAEGPTPIQDSSLARVVLGCGLRYAEAPAGFDLSEGVVGADLGDDYRLALLVPDIDEKNNATVSHVVKIRNQCRLSYMICPDTQNLVCMYAYKRFDGESALFYSSYAGSLVIYEAYEEDGDQNCSLAFDQDGAVAYVTFGDHYMLGSVGETSPLFESMNDPPKQPATDSDKVLGRVVASSLLGPGVLLDRQIDQVRADRDAVLQNMIDSINNKPRPPRQLLVLS